VTSDELTGPDATELARRVRTREVSPVEIAEAHLARIEELNPRLNAVVTPMDALGVAREAEAAVLRGDELGPLHGVPFTVKDCIDTAGVRTTRGSLLFVDHLPKRDATAVARMKSAGAVPLGKTNLPEFALWWETDNLVFGRTVNPWNVGRTAGGSSGGEAAAIAAGLSPVGLGSDLGGSIRVPASHCGCVGLKATHGRVPLTGHWPDAILRFMHIGPMARSVRDVALALSVLAGPDELDWWCAPAPPPAAAVEESVAGLRVAALPRTGFGPVGAEVAAAVERAAAALGARGCAVEEPDLPWLEPRDCNVLTMTLYGAEGSTLFGPLVAGREDELHWFLRRRLSLPRDPGEKYLAAEAEVEALRRDVAELFTRVDALLCPTVPLPAHEHDLAELTIGDRSDSPRAIMRATIPWDLTGSPALTVPFALSDEGLPIGVQLVGRRFDEPTLFRLGSALETARAPRIFRPPL
jgi:aspartyl-tRNA(Asn)/glutamyl-tRNA(Gln) amidotransferase subunit A